MCSGTTLDEDYRLTISTTRVSYYGCCLSTESVLYLLRINCTLILIYSGSIRLEYRKSKRGRHREKHLIATPCHYTFNNSNSSSSHRRKHMVSVHVCNRKNPTTNHTLRWHHTTSVTKIDYTQTVECVYVRNAIIKVKQLTITTQCTHITSANVYIATDRRLYSSISHAMYLLNTYCVVCRYLYTVIRRA